MKHALYLPPSSGFPIFGGDGVVVAGTAEEFYSYNAAIEGHFDGTVRLQLLNGNGRSRKGLSLNGTLVALLPGDFNGDSVVNAADYTVYRQDLGAFTDASDFAAFVGNYGVASGGAAAVPEPAGLLLAACGALLRRRPVRRRPRGLPARLCPRGPGSRRVRRFLAA